MAKRSYKPATIFNMRVINMRNLWEPAKEFQGRPVDKPAYIISAMVKKTRANWYEEPDLAQFTKAAQELYSEALAPLQFQQIEWPIKDGDIGDPVKGNPEWRTGHWLLTATSTLPVEVSIIRHPTGQPVPLKKQEGVKNGDYVGLNVSLAVKMNDPRGVKCYLNKVMFMAEGEEIVIGSTKSMTEMADDAKAQGLNVTGFGSSGPPQQGFGLGAQPGFPPVGSAPGPASPAFSPAPAPFAAPPAGNASFPSSGPTQPPAGFNAPTGFPPRQ